jgi:hypothetical protein
MQRAPGGKATRVPGRNGGVPRYAPAAGDSELTSPAWKRSR